MRLATLLCMTLLASTSHAKLVTYTYQGANWDYVLDPATYDWEANGVDPEPWAHNPFQTAAQQSFTGFMILDTDKLPGGTNKNISLETFLPIGPCTDGCEETAIHYWSFFDGVYTRNTYENYPLAWQFFSIATDSLGNLTSWIVDLADDPDYMYLSSRFGDRRYVGNCGNVYPLECVSTNTPGTWTQVPEPGAMGLMLAVLSITFLVRRRRQNGLSSSS